MENKSLGRGLSSLIGQDNNNSKLAPNQVAAPYFPKIKQGLCNQILNLAVNKIKANPHQPRKTFSEIPLNDLVASVKEYGIIL